MNTTIATLKGKHPVSPWPAIGLLLLSSSWLLAGSLQTETLVLTKGEAFQLPITDGVKQVFLGDDQTLHAQPIEQGNAVTLQDFADGFPPPRAESSQGPALAHEVAVRSNLQKMHEEIKELLFKHGVLGLTTEVVGDRIWIRGSLPTRELWNLKNKILQPYSSYVQDTTEFDSLRYDRFVAERLLERLKDKGLETVTVDVNQDVVILDGWVGSDYEKGLAEEVVKLLLPQSNVRNLLRIAENVIETNVEFFQVRADDSSDIGYNILKNLGVGVQGSFAGRTSGKPIGSWGVAADASVRINALVAKGIATNAARVNVSAAHGSQGRTMVGGELYIPISGNVGGSVEKVPYGVILTVKPNLQGNDTLLMEVDFEVSVPVPGPAPNTIEVLKDQTKTTVTCKLGETVVLSGLTRTLGGFSREKTPVVGDFPLLNLFFSHKGRTKRREELVVLMTPHLVKAENTGAKPFSEERKHLRESAGAVH